MGKFATLSAAALIGLLTAAPAAARIVMYSYDSTTPITQKMTEGGITDTPAAG